MLVANLILLIFVSTASCRIYLYKINQEHQQSAETDTSTTSSEATKTSIERDKRTELESLELIKRLINAIPKKQKCEIRFGSMYGTKAQKELCIKKKLVFKQSKRVKDLRQQLSNDDSETNTQKSRPFSTDYLDVDVLNRNEDSRFSDDYLDVSDVMRTVDNEIITPEKTKCQAVTSYKDNHDILKHKKNCDGITRKFRKNMRYNTFSDSSEEYSDKSKNSDSSSEYSQRSDEGHKNKHVDSSEESIESNTNTNKKNKKPNRFHVVNNIGHHVSKSKKHDFKIKSEEDRLNKLMMDSFETETKENLPKDSSEEEVKNKKVDEMYLQGGNKIMNILAEAMRSEVARRRLPHFLPKRYHWNSDEMQHLGYYWFNGPKGRYP